MKKRGQLTIFIIVAAIIIAAIILFFLFRTGTIPSLIGGFEEDPQIYLENCLEPQIKEAIDLLNKQGGNTEPTLYKRFKFGDEDYQNITYLCHTDQNHMPCTNQEPVLITHLEKEIHNYISDDIQECFLQWQEDIEKQDYSAETGNLNFQVKLEPEKVIIEANKSISLIKKDESLQYEEFRIVIKDKLYDLAIVVQEILSQEARFCNFEEQGFMIFYPEFEIDKHRTSDLDLIYTVADRKSKEKFRFAVRTCVIPSGI